MIKERMPNGNIIAYSSTWIESIAHMCMEHYNSHTDKVIGINTTFDDTMVLKKTTDKKVVLLNLEHKYPINENGGIEYCSDWWTYNYNKNAREELEELWEFQIEDFEYAKFHGIENKFRFKPLRYTTWFDKYKVPAEPKYDIQLECVFDTNTRIWMIFALTGNPVTVIDGNTYTLGERVSVNLTNTGNSDLKFAAKNECRYGLDVPHYDTPCTINCTRIYEYMCMNKPVIVWDKYKITSRKYFNDLCIYMEDFTSYNVKLATMQKPRTDVAEVFRQMTYSDKDYDEYRLNIIRDYKDRTGITVPDYVMY